MGSEDASIPKLRNPVVFVHGYSDKGASWLPWRRILREQLGYGAADLRTCTYVSLNNEVTIKDLAEAFDRALSTEGGLVPNQSFDAIVHSTGMLVVRSWLAADPLRGRRMKRLIALAPATFGSPLAKEGRSWLGAVFKGNKQLSPDFLDAGNRILDELELGSSFTWRLTEEDVFNNPPRFDAGLDTPYVFVFCGTGGYTGLRRLVDKPGTDGTVRRAGCSLNARRIDIDLTETGSVTRRLKPEVAAAAELSPADRIIADRWLNVAIPVHLVGDPSRPEEANHATILSDPVPELVDLVVAAFEMTEAATTAGVDPEAMYSEWLTKADAAERYARLTEQYQQFIVHAVDERGDAITDYHIELSRTDKAGGRIAEFDAEVDVYSGDASYRCFHVDVAGLLPKAGDVTAPGLAIRLIASSGTPYVGYLGYGCEEQIEAGSWDAALEFDGPALVAIGFFRPYTTTLIRLYVERQVMPPDRNQPCSLLVWDPLDPLSGSAPADS
jgi:pimeloyl-ACP methyl ester carboxylesterase